MLCGRHGHVCSCNQQLAAATRALPQGLDAIEDDMTISNYITQPILRSFHEDLHPWMDLFRMWPQGKEQSTFGSRHSGTCVILWTISVSSPTGVSLSSALSPPQWPWPHSHFASRTPRCFSGISRSEKQKLLVCVPPFFSLIPAAATDTVSQLIM